MKKPQKNQFSGPRTSFHDRRLPERAIPVGYAALIDAYDLAVPVPRTLSAVGARHVTYRADGWKIYTPRHLPDATLQGHLIFALRHEGVDLAVLKRLFLSAGATAIASLVTAEPTGRSARRLWFLYEWLLGERLDLPDAKRGVYIPVLDPKRQVSVTGSVSSRHRVRNNLPGTPAFCPLVTRTPVIDTYLLKNLKSIARSRVAMVPKDVLSRAAAFLLLNDSRSSFAIEGESPPGDRIQRWGRVIGEAGHCRLDQDELLRLQEIVIGDNRFVQLGLRKEGGFVGEHDRNTREPLPDHIDARVEDLQSLVSGLIDFDSGPARETDPVVAAAVLAFGFIYIHPFQDGNGRVHRYLIHHRLAESGFNPPGVVFPVSAAILRNIEGYRAALESYSKRLLPLVEWRPTERGNVQVLNDTADFYRFFDATPHAEFLYDCVEQTIEIDLPQETRFLTAHDSFRVAVQQLVDMPDRTLDLLFHFLRQGSGRLSKRARAKEFASLRVSEVEKIERAYEECFAGLDVDASNGTTDSR